MKERRLGLAAALCIVAGLALSALTGCGDVDSGGSAESLRDVPENAERVVIFGEITDAIGNMVTLNLIERPVALEMSEEEMAERRTE